MVQFWQGLRQLVHGVWHRFTLCKVAWDAKYWFNINFTDKRGHSYCFRKRLPRQQRNRFSRIKQISLHALASWACYEHLLNDFNYKSIRKHVMSRRYIVCIDVVNYTYYRLFEICMTLSKTNSNKGTVNSHEIIVPLFKCINTEWRNLIWTWTTL
jgi:hypothetical protein